MEPEVILPTLDYRSGGKILLSRASTNFQILEVLNFLPLNIWRYNSKFQEVLFCDAILSKFINMYFTLIVLFLAHLQHNVH